jgi:hypothetical protein
VRQAIEALPAKQRAAVLMHKYEGLDYAQIAAVLSCSESAIKSLLFRAYESLRGTGCTWREGIELSLRKTMICLNKNEQGAELLTGYLAKTLDAAGMAKWTVTSGIAPSAAAGVGLGKAGSSSRRPR